MSQLEKLKQRLKQYPKDFTYHELQTLMCGLGFVANNRGKTSGSRVCFYRQTDAAVFSCHKPHPAPYVKAYTLKKIVTFLTEKGDI